MGKCQICSNPLKVLLDFGPQPVCNRYLEAKSKKEYRFPLILSQCTADGLLQLGKPWPANQVRPKLEWISYIEPESHLDDMTDRIIQMKGVTKECLIVGLSYKDEPVLSRFEVKGYKNTHNIELSELGIEFGSGMETIQKVLSPNLALKLKEDVGTPKVIIVRHLLEHSESISRTLSTLSTWGDEDSYFIFEVPDSEKTFQKLDYGTLWEEHVCYFTENTLAQTFEPNGLTLQSISRYQYTLEDCLVAIVSNRKRQSLSLIPEKNIKKELLLGKMIGDGYKPMIKNCKLALDEMNKKGDVVMFGAGHRAITFINLLKLESKISCIIDDDPKKTGLLLPGSQLPIVTSERLYNDNSPKLCILAASPDNEKQIINKNQSYLDNGGDFKSIYPGSENAWHPLRTLM
jgi:hypothetical protein